MKKQIYISLFFGLLLNVACAQTTTPPKNTLEKAETVGADFAPAQFPGGEKALMQYIKEHLKYPKMALENGVEGKVFLKLTIEADGSVSEATVLRGIGSGCDDEAVRLAKSLPNFIPLVRNGKAIRQTYNLPISFIPN
ncbi:MAG: hypothetical protein RI894_1762 [Bacteroidota bacterium]|jgi:TonB family protein